MRGQTGAKQENWDQMGSVRMDKGSNKDSNGIKQEIRQEVGKRIEQETNKD